MKITVLLFARLREIAGQDAVELEVSEPATMGKTWAVLQKRFPDLASWTHPPLMTCDRQYASPDVVLKGGEEVAFLPPVSGGKEDPLFKIVEAPIELDPLIRQVLGPGNGAVATFLGVVRERNQGKMVVAIEYHTYREMAEGQMRAIGEEMKRGFGTLRMALVHRVGRLVVGEASVAIVAASPHRHQALGAVSYAIERLKQIVPIWKKEFYADGSAWLEPAPSTDPK